LLAARFTYCGWRSQPINAPPVGQDDDWRCAWASQRSRRTSCGSGGGGVSRAGSSVVLYAATRRASEERSHEAATCARHRGAEASVIFSRGIAAGLSARAIAALIGRSASTVSREIARSGGRDAYRAQTVPARVEPGAACRCAGPTGGGLVSRADRRVASPRTSHRSHAAPSLRPLGEAPAQGAGLARSWPVAEHGLDPGSSCRRDRAVRGRALGRRPAVGVGLALDQLQPLLVGVAEHALASAEQDREHQHVVTVDRAGVGEVTGEGGAAVDDDRPARAASPCSRAARDP
jgi:hypothetical protein